MPNELDLYQLSERLARLRACRRRLGWFDFSSDSWDMRTTMARALRIFRRVNGFREPLANVHNDRPIHWNAYHG
jgi:hypothetical protein